MVYFQAIDPDTLTAINDYELARSDKGRCFNKYTGPFFLKFPAFYSTSVLTSGLSFSLNGTVSLFAIFIFEKTKLEDANYDIVGLQSHMFPGLNGHFLKNRFDTMADPGKCSN